MKTLCLSILVLLVGLSACAQQQTTAKRIIALDSLYLNGSWLKKVNTTAAQTTTTPNQEVPSVGGMKAFVAAQIAASGGGFTKSVLSTPTNGTATVQIPIEDNSCGTVEAEVHGGSLGGYAIVGRKVVRYEKSNGIVSILGIVTEIFPTSKKLLNAADFDFEINSTSQGFQVLVTGETGIPITWEVTWRKNPTTL